MIKRSNNINVRKKVSIGKERFRQSRHFQKLLEAFLFYLIGPCFVLGVLPATERSAKARPLYQSDFNMMTESYLNQAPGDGPSHLTHLAGRLKIRHESYRAETHLDFGAGAYLSKDSEGYILVPEAYFGYRFDTWQLYLGRRKARWNLLDEVWQFGSWQPLFRWDPLNPVLQGLTGLFAEYDSKMFRAQLYVSPTYIPEQNPPFHLQDGQIHSESPWFREPYRYISFSENSQVPLHYEIHRPDLQNVVFNKSYGTSLQWGRKLRGPQLSLSFVDKPRNQLALSFKNLLKTSEVKSQPTLAEITILPTTVRHQLWGTDVSYHLARHIVWASYYYDRPTQANFAPNTSHPRFYGREFFGAGIDFLGFADNKTGFSILNVSGPKAELRSDLLEQPIGDSYSETLLYRQAFQWYVKGTLWQNRQHRLDGQLRWTRDVKSPGTILSGGFRYQPFPLLIMALDVDLIASDSNNALSSAHQSSFIQQHQRNDRIRGGIHYVF